MMRENVGRKGKVEKRSGGAGWLYLQQTRKIPIRETLFLFLVIPATPRSSQKNIL
jgi:hypothetical protein